MIERVHEHITGELSTNARTDTIFVIAALLLNFLTLGINSAIAAGNNTDSDTQTIVIVIFVALIIVVNFVAELGLVRGRQMRKKLLEGLLKMYKDQGVEGYYDSSLLSDYSLRYNLFMLVVVFTGLVAIIVPFIIR